MLNGKPKFYCAIVRNTYRNNCLILDEGGQTVKPKEVQ